MHALFAAPWRPVPASTLMVLGVVMVLWGVAREADGLRLPATDPAKAPAVTRCLRSAVLGLALFAVGAGWLWQMPLLAAVACVIVCEEMWETSAAAGALRDAAAKRAGRPRPPP